MLKCAIVLVDIYSVEVSVLGGSEAGTLKESTYTKNSNKKQCKTHDNEQKSVRYYKTFDTTSGIFAEITGSNFCIDNFLPANFQKQLELWSVSELFCIRLFFVDYHSFPDIWR